MSQLVAPIGGQEVKKDSGTHLFLSSLPIDVGANGFHGVTAEQFRIPSKSGPFAAHAVVCALFVDVDGLCVTTETMVVVTRSRVVSADRVRTAVVALSWF